MMAIRSRAPPTAPAIMAINEEDDACARAVARHNAWRGRKDSGSQVGTAQR